MNTVFLAIFCPVSSIVCSLSLCKYVYRRNTCDIREGHLIFQLMSYFKIYGTFHVMVRWHDKASKKSVPIFEEMLNILL